MQPVPPGCWTLYILENDEAVRESICALAASSGWRHRAFSCAPAFFRQVCAGERGCLLVDWDLPGVDADGFLRALQDHYPKLPLVVMTARDDPTNLARIEATAPAAILPRPFTFPELSQAVAKALRQLSQGEAEPRPRKQRGA